MATPTGSPNPGSTVRQATMREFLAVVFRRRGLILGLFASVTLTVVVLTLVTPVSYISSGRVLLLRGERQSALSPLRIVMNDWEADLASEVETAQSSEVVARTRKVLEARAAAAGTKPLPVDPKSVGVEVMGKSNVLAIGYTDPDPKRAHEVCDALLSAYLDYRQNGRRVPGQDAFFSHQVDSLTGVIEKRMRERELIAERTGMSDPDKQGQNLDYQIAQFEGRRNEAEAELAEATSLLRVMKDLRNNPNIDLPTFGTPFTNEAALEALKAKVTDQQAYVAKLRERYRDDSPEVQSAMQTLETLQALLRREVDAKITLQQARIDNLRAKLAVHERDLASLRAEQTALPVSQHRLEDLDAEIKTLRQRVEEYGKARDQMQITSHTSQELSVVLLNPAGAAVAKNAHDYVRLALAPAFSIVVGVGLAFFLDGLDLTVRTAGQAEEYLELPVLATLSERRSKRG